MGELLAGVVLGVVGGVLADGFDRQRVLLASDARRAAVLVLAWAAGPRLRRRLDARAGLDRRTAVPAPSGADPAHLGPRYAASSIVGVVAAVPWLLPLGWLVKARRWARRWFIGEMLVVESGPEDAPGAGPSWRWACC